MILPANFSIVSAFFSFIVISLAAEAKLKPAVEDKSIQIPEGLSLKKFADETQVMNPTALCLDAKGRVYVAETHRWRKQVQNIRAGRGYLKERVEGDILLLTLADRAKYHQKWGQISPSQFMAWEDFRANAEKIRLLEDRDGDGRADEAKYFRDDFNEALAGTTGGIEERDGTIYFASIPGIYSLRDNDGDGKAEEVKTLVEGFGVRVSLSGHDLNGFAFGPDGKIYFTMGDRGYHLEHEGKVFAGADRGAVFRCNRDGSDLEIFYHRLRNPKELAFDKFGNLFTGDNDYDHGDSERIVYLVEHGDAGWQMGHQTLASFGSQIFEHMLPKSEELIGREDPWMAEGMWRMRHELQPAYLLPPVALTVNGPGGLVYHPGVTSFGPRYADTFFLTSYLGSRTKCKVESFQLESMGGGFSLKWTRPLVKNIAATDITFGYDGKLYISDFIGGWLSTDQGAVWALSDEEGLQEPALKIVEALARRDFAELENERLVDLLKHADMRIRQRAQFGLVLKGKSDFEGIRTLFEKGCGPQQPLLKRLHCIWGLGQMATSEPEALRIFGELLEDSELEVRANAARTLSWHSELVSPFRAQLIGLLEDSSARVASLAALTLANEGHSDSVEPALELLARNDDEDAYLRHGGIMILARAASAPDLGFLSSHPSDAVRLATVVALRRKKAGEIDRFIDDGSELVRKEAVRGIYDENIVSALPALADRALLIASAVALEEERFPLTAKRAIYAAWRLGRESDVESLVRILNNQELEFRVRRAALVALLDWNEPPVADPVVGTAVPLPAGRLRLSSENLGGLEEFFLQVAEDPEKKRLLFLALNLWQQVGGETARSVLEGYAKSSEYADEARVLAIKLLEGGGAHYKELLLDLLESRQAAVRSHVREALLKVEPDFAFLLLGENLKSEKTTVSEKQQTIQILGRAKNEVAEDALVKALSQAGEGSLENGVLLDLILAGEASESEKVKQALLDYRGTLPDEPLAEWLAACVEGGDVGSGQDVFLNHGAAQCARCHIIDGVGGKVGPDLSAIGKSKDRDYLLRALIQPSSEVAVGYGAGSVTLKTGEVLSGIVLADDAEGNAVLQVGEEEKMILKEEVATRSEPISAMPAMNLLLDKEQVRDLVSYLASRKKDLAEEKNK